MLTRCCSFSRVCDADPSPGSTLHADELDKVWMVRVLGDLVNASAGSEKAPGMMHVLEPGSRRLTANLCRILTMYLQEEEKTTRWGGSRMRDGRKEQWTDSTRE